MEASTTTEPTGGTQHDDGFGVIEHELTSLIRRAERVRLLGAAPGIGVLDRSAYAILGRLFDDGPLRLSAVATLYNLDVSTVSRQVAALESAGLVQRAQDPGDARASLLRPTERGVHVLEATRASRRDLLRAVLRDWDPGDRVRFGELLARFNADAETHFAGTADGGRR